MAFLSFFGHSLRRLLISVGRGEGRRGGGNTSGEGNTLTLEMRGVSQFYNGSR